MRSRSPRARGGNAVKRGGKQRAKTSASAIPRGRLTMADLARLAGVSKITVSRAMGDSALVNPNTRARVRELARQHGYALNVTARNLRLRRSHTVAVIVEMAPTPERPMSGPYTPIGRASSRERVCQ